MNEWPFRLVAVVGFLSLCGIAWVTGTRGRVNGKTILGSMVLAWVIAAATFWLPGSKWVLAAINDVLVATLAAAQKGSVFLFGPLAVGPGQSLADGTQSVGFILAMQALPAVVFFAALVSGLYYLKIMPAIVGVFARLFYRAMGLSGAEALTASANIFVGIESSLTVQPYLLAMTRSELLTLLTCMMATVASTVMAIYVMALQDIFPQIAGHLISASVISIPCAVLISKLSLPEEEVPLTLGKIPSEPSNARRRRGYLARSRKGAPCKSHRRPHGRRSSGRQDGGRYCHVINCVSRIGSHCRSCLRTITSDSWGTAVSDAPTRLVRLAFRHPLGPET